MKKLVRPFLLSMLSASAFVAHAASDTFPTGQSFWGEPAAGTSETRRVDAKTRHVRVHYGETLVFQDDAGRQFAWKFNGLDRTAVEVSRIAPADFHTAKTTVYVGQNPLTKR